MHYIKKKFLSRRKVLQAAGVSIALPLLDAMIPAFASAQQTKAAKRFVYLYFPHGFWPGGPGRVGGPNSLIPSGGENDFVWPTGLEPRAGEVSNLKKHRGDLLFLGGMWNPWGAYGYPGNAGEGNDNENDHAAAPAAFLACARPNRSPEKLMLTLNTGSNRNNTEILNFRSADVMTAELIGSGTRTRLLHITPPGLASGDGNSTDRYWTRSYRSGISWSSATKFTPRLDTPALVFEELFGRGTPQTPGGMPSPGTKIKKSKLDYIKDQRTALMKDLGPSDQAKVKDFFDAISEVEKKIDGDNSQQPACATGSVPANSIDPAVRIKTQMDLIVLALKCDRTRVASFMMEFELDNNDYRNAAGFSRGSGNNSIDGSCHLASHGFFRPKGTNGKFEEWRKINLFFANQFAYLVDRLKVETDTLGPLFDSSLVLFGSGTNTDDDDHNDANLPFILAGTGGGLVRPGRFLKLADPPLAKGGQGVPIANYHLTMLQKLGAKIGSFANSNGLISGL